MTHFLRMGTQFVRADRVKSIVQNGSSLTVDIDGTSRVLEGDAATEFVQQIDALTPRIADESQVPDCPEGYLPMGRFRKGLKARIGVASKPGRVDNPVRSHTLPTGQKVYCVEDVRRNFEGPHLIEEERAK